MPEVNRGKRFWTPPPLHLIITSVEMFLCFNCKLVSALFWPAFQPPLWAACRIFYFHCYPFVQSSPCCCLLLQRQTFLCLCNSSMTATLLLHVFRFRIFLFGQSKYRYSWVRERMNIGDAGSCQPSVPLSCLHAYLNFVNFRNKPRTKKKNQESER